jgi:hypothetical protein
MVSEQVVYPYAHVLLLLWWVPRSSMARISARGMSVLAWTLQSSLFFAPDQKRFY